MIEKEGFLSPLVLFPEGTTTNNTQLMKFKRGAFYAEKRVSPVLLKYKQSQVNTLGTFSAAWDTDEFFPHVILQLSLPPCYFACEIICLPDFEPNEFLFEKFASKGETRWEIFAWAVRDIMVKQGGFKECDMSWRHKIQYEKYMRMNKGATIPEYCPGGVPPPAASKTKVSD